MIAFGTPWSASAKPTKLPFTPPRRPALHNPNQNFPHNPNALFPRSSRPIPATSSTIPIFFKGFQASSSLFNPHQHSAISFYSSQDTCVGCRYNRTSRFGGMREQSMRRAAVWCHTWRYPAGRRCWLVGIVTVSERGHLARVTRGSGTLAAWAHLQNSPFSIPTCFDLTPKVAQKGSATAPPWLRTSQPPTVDSDHIVLSVLLLI